MRIGLTVEIDEPQSAEEYRRKHARDKAIGLVRMVRGTMALESQAMDPATTEQMVEHTMHELLNSNRRLWDQ